MSAIVSGPPICRRTTQSRRTFSPGAAVTVDMGRRFYTRQGGDATAADDATTPIVL
jgi:hypothetical protein